MNLDRTGFTSIEQVTGQYLGNTGKVNTGNAEISFEEVLRQQVKDKEQPEELKFSKHAVQRLNDRNISLSETQLERLQNGARLSSEKGIRESLVVMDEYAFIVNTRNNTVITAMEQGRQGENIYTNIDGAVFV
ncbi:MAG: TIGR02530 family flagellar biosynthesis protein [Butyrivibrio sp.]